MSKLKIILPSFVLIGSMSGAAKIFSMQEEIIKKDEKPTNIDVKNEPEKLISNYFLSENNPIEYLLDNEPQHDLYSENNIKNFSCIFIEDVSEPNETVDQSCEIFGFEYDKNNDLDFGRLTAGSKSNKIKNKSKFIEDYYFQVSASEDNIEILKNKQIKNIKIVSSANKSKVFAVLNSKALFLKNTVSGARTIEELNKEANSTYLLVSPTANGGRASVDLTNNTQVNYKCKLTTDSKTIEDETCKVYDAQSQDEKRNKTIETHKLQPPIESRLIKNKKLFKKIAYYQISIDSNKLNQFSDPSKITLSIVNKTNPNNSIMSFNSIIKFRRYKMIGKSKELLIQIKNKPSSLTCDSNCSYKFIKGNQEKSVKLLNLIGDTNGTIKSKTNLTPKTHLRNIQNQTNANLTTINNETIAVLRVSNDSDTFDIDGLKWREFNIKVNDNSEMLRISVLNIISEDK